ncbi:MAG: GtrA family protein [Chitinophagia bacterium]|nr:GtrA family protein [Chitinophagia bacterium]NDE78358.1 GtrA family protein [Chitinophagaceae bacterium]
MNQLFELLASLIRGVLDFFYPLFRRFMPLQTFRYLVTGSTNTLIGIVVYFICYTYWFQGTVFNLGFYAFKAHSAALLASFMVTFPLGFFFSKFVVFSDSHLRSRIQLFRYLLICLFNLFLNYLLLKVQVEVLLIDPLLAQFVTVSGVVIFSYLAQRNFSFKRKE